MRYKVPQNIDIQDRIVGPLTMLQFLYAVIGGGLTYSIYMTLPKPFSHLLAIPVALFTICLAIVKINERPFLDFFLAVAQFMGSPKNRIWRHDISDNLAVTIYASTPEKKTVEPKHISKEKLHEFADKLDKE